MKNRKVTQMFTNDMFLFFWLPIAIPVVITVIAFGAGFAKCLREEMQQPAPVAAVLYHFRGSERGVALWATEEGYLLKNDSNWNHRDWSDTPYRRFVPAFAAYLVGCCGVNSKKTFNPQTGERY